MQKLILVRHGSYHFEEAHLDGWGFEKMTLLGQRLRVRTQGLNVLLLSSPAPSAFESALLLSQALETHPWREEILRYGGSPELGQSKILELIRTEACETSDVVVLVTHLQHICGFPCFFTKEVWGTAIPQPEEIGYGEALEIDCKARAFKHIK